MLTKTAGLTLFPLTVIVHKQGQCLSEEGRLCQAPGVALAVQNLGVCVKPECGWVGLAFEDS